MYKDSFNHRKKYYIKIFTSIYVIVFLVSALVIAANWKKVMNIFSGKEIEVNQEHLLYNDVFNKVQKLEMLSKEYDESNYQLRAIVYIRSAKYNDEYWNMFGTYDEDFARYVAQNQGDSNVVALRNLKSGFSFCSPRTGHEVDFYHLFAALNGLMYENKYVADLTGWGGDMFQLANGFANTTYSGEQLLNKIRQEMDQIGNYFGTSDRNADFDAVNIYNIMENSSFANGSIYLSSMMYYLSANLTEQVEVFKENTFNDKNLTATEMEELIFNRLQMLSTLLETTYGYNACEASDDILQSCIKVFVEYLEV